MRAVLKDPEILHLAGKVTYEVDPRSSFPKHYGGEVIVRTSDGRELRRREAVNRGSADRPLSNEDIVAKFVENASYAGVSNPEKITCAILELDGGTPARELEAVLGAA